MNGIAVFYKRANPADSVVQEIRLFIILPEKAEAIPSDLFKSRDAPSWARRMLDWIHSHNSLQASRTRAPGVC